MADVSIKYKGATIAELDSTGTKTMKTGGTYCEDNIVVDYAPRTKSYDVTIVDGTWGYKELTVLDAEVLEHIYDENFMVFFVRVGEFEYAGYKQNGAFATNRQILQFNDGNGVTRPVYGTGLRQSSDTTAYGFPIYYPASNEENIGPNQANYGYGMFKLVRTSGNKYYYQAGDGGIFPGNYRLTFTW